MSSIVVSSTSELQEAYATLSNEPGGGEILIASGAENIAIQLSGGGSEPVSISSADADNPSTITQLSVVNAENVSISNLELNSGDLGRGLDTYDPAEYDLFVSGSSNISVDNMTFTGQAEGIYDPNDPTASLGSIRYSEDVTFTNSTVQNYFHGLFLYESSDLTIDDNEWTEMQGDGIRMEGVQQVSISGNHMHSFLGSPNDVNHDDMIQMWTVNTQTISSDIEIIGNIFNSAGAAGSQTILIQNERDQENPEGWYQNITISDNIIYNSHLHGIRVSGVDGLDVSDNTLLWNLDSGLIQSGPDDLQSLSPRIEVYAASDAFVTNNITGAVSVSGGAVATDNHIVDYEDPTDPNYIGNNFTNALTNGYADLRDLALLEDSAFVGAGAEMSQPGVAIGPDMAVMAMSESDGDVWERVFSADLSTAGNSNSDYVWTFSDGTTLVGETVTHQFTSDGMQSVTLSVMENGQVVDSIIRDVMLENRTYLEFDFAESLSETSGNDISYWGLEEDNLAADGYMIGGDDKVYINRSNEDIHGLDKFHMEIDLALDSVGQGGYFVHLHGSLKAWVSDSGKVNFELITDEGKFTVNTGDVVISDTDMHNIGITYDSGAGTLGISLDGEAIAETEASGTTTHAQEQHLILGYDHGDSLEATIGSFYLGYNEDRDGSLLEPSSQDDQEVPASENDPVVLPVEDPTVDVSEETTGQELEDETVTATEETEVTNIWDLIWQLIKVLLEGDTGTRAETVEALVNQHAANEEEPDNVQAYCVLPRSSEAYGRELNAFEEDEEEEPLEGLLI